MLIDRIPTEDESLLLARVLPRLASVFSVRLAQIALHPVDYLAADRALGEREWRLVGRADRDGIELEWCGGGDGRSPPLETLAPRLLGVAGAAEHLQFVLASRLALRRKVVVQQVAEERVSVSDVVAVRFAVAMNMVEFKTLGRAAVLTLDAVVGDRLFAYLAAAVAGVAPPMLSLARIASSVAAMCPTVSETPLIGRGRLAATGAIDGVRPLPLEAAFAVRAAAREQFRRQGTS